MKSLVTALAALSLVWVSGEVQAHTVIFQGSGVNASYLDQDVVLPGSGSYRVSFTSPDEASWSASLFYLDHWDVFRAPPPQPHHAYIEGNDGETVDLETGYGRSFSAVFVVPKTTRDFFDSGEFYRDSYGIPIGTPLYLERRAENPYLKLFGENLVGEDVRPLTYDVTVTLLSIPEPATWGLLIGGFGLVGVALRHPRGA